MKVCVLLPDYSTSAVDYQHYDPARNLKPLLPDDEVTTIFLNKLTTYKQLKEASTKGYDIFVNLCEGYLEWEVPSIDVIYTLELLNLPFTGPTTFLYDPPKDLMKYVAFCADVATPLFFLYKKNDAQILLPNNMNFPLFVKPAKAGDSLGVDEHSLVHTQKQLQQKIHALQDEYNDILIEEYIDGREFTVLVLANANNTCTALQPVEYIFPEGRQFKTYALKTSELHLDANMPVKDATLNDDLKLAAENIFIAFNGKGYARLDFRMNANGEIYFLEINFTCSVFYSDGYEGSADYILKYDGIGQQNFLQQIIGEGIVRHQAKQKKYSVKGNAIDGYGIYATRNIMLGEVIFKGEEMAQRIVTKKYVDEHWNEKQKNDFARYAYPVSNAVYILWSNNPEDWAPQNHSCQANSQYVGLNVVAIENIKMNDELTLDYASYLDDTAQSFECKCGSNNCRGIITGNKANRVK